MKRKQTILLLAAACGAILFAGCKTTPKHIKTLMHDADSMKVVDPRNALMTILKVDPEGLATQSDNARYAILFCEIFDKNSIFISSDSLILPALKYYERHGSRVDKARANLYMGKYKNTLYDMAGALEYYQKAYKLLRPNQAPDVYGEICGSIARLYGVKADSTIVLYYAKKAVEAFGKATMPKQRNKAAVFVGIVYNINKEYETAYKWQEQSYRWATEDNDNELASEAMRNMAFNRFKLSDYKAAKHILLDQMPALGLKLSTHSYNILADIYESEGKPDSAASVRKLVGDQALPLFVKVADSNDTNFWLQKYNITKEELAKTREENDRFKRQNDVLIAEQRLTYVLAGSSCIVLILIMAFLHTRSAYRRREVSNLLHNKNDIMHQISQLYYQDGENDRIMREKLYQITSSQFDGRSFKELEHLLNIEYGGIMTRIRKEFPEYTDKDINYIALICANYSPQELSVIMQTTIAAAYKRRSRYRDRMRNSQSLNRRQKALFSGEKTSCPK